MVIAIIIFLMNIVVIRFGIAIIATSNTAIICIIIMILILILIILINITRPSGPNATMIISKVMLLLLTALIQPLSLRPPGYSGLTWACREFWWVLDGIVSRPMTITIDSRVSFQVRRVAVAQKNRLFPVFGTSLVGWGCGALVFTSFLLHWYVESTRTQDLK